MANCQEAAIAGFNRFLKDQQTVEGMAKLTLVLFDDEYEVLVRSVPVAEVTELDATAYVPRGSTALLDAMGTTIDLLRDQIASVPEKDRPAQVIIATLTDGFENASDRFTWKDVSKRIKHQTKAHHWTFLFLGANQDAIATAAKMNIPATNAATYIADPDGSISSMASVSRKVSSLRRTLVDPAAFEHDEDANASLSSLLDEESSKHRTKSKTV